jgi:glutathione peroxidase-family protein
MLGFPCNQFIHQTAMTANIHLCGELRRLLPDDVSKIDVAAPALSLYQWLSSAHRTCSATVDQMDCEFLIDGTRLSGARYARPTNRPG